MQKRNQYFQTIARHFFEQRGTPFYLSSKELDLIATWEKKEIPLRVVLEGMKEAFENHRMKPGKKGKIMSLSYCNSHVLRAFEQHRERKVGQKRKAVGKDRKDEKIRVEITKYLKCIPGHLDDLKEMYFRVQKELLRRNLDEEGLESIEAEIEEVIVKSADEKERKKVEKEVLVEFPIKENEEFERIFRIKLIKHLRDKYKLPHVSPFYY